MHRYFVRFYLKKEANAIDDYFDLLLLYGINNLNFQGKKDFERLQQGIIEIILESRETLTLSDLKNRFRGLEFLYLKEENSNRITTSLNPSQNTRQLKIDSGLEGIV
ncbi:MAG: hypothetical protein QXF25_01045 [Candidatus Pacearchaeota archaeon]